MIKIKNLTKKYNDVTVIDNANYNFPNKGLVCLLGKSGSGKSTFLNILAGFDSNYIGDVKICDTNINKMTSNELCNYRRDNIGFIFQNYELLKGYTVLENVSLPCELINEEKYEYIKKAKNLIEQLGIAKKENEKIENLSGGQKQRVAIARALIKKPNIILADEPTGSLDRKNSQEIMELLKQISQEKLVVVITHDKKICDFADEVISIEDKKIIIKKEREKEKEEREKETIQKIIKKAPIKVNISKIGMKNFKVHLGKFITISLAVSIGIICFILSLSLRNIMEQSINNFKEKNTAHNNGYIKIENQEDVFELLNADERIENIYKQYKINNLTLSIKNKTEKIIEKYPMPKATESMSYGIMPRIGKNEIVLSPSLAKKFAKNMNELIGQELVLTYDEKDYNLTVSGIFNAGYDDFFVSSDIEQLWYTNKKMEDCYSISYDVKKFEEIVSVNDMLNQKNIQSKNAAKEVQALQNTFQNLNLLFLIISILIMIIGLFIGIILIFKLQFSRYREIGLLSALGFNKRTIQKIIMKENIFLFIITCIFNVILIGIIFIFKFIFTLPISISSIQIISSSLLSGIIVTLISILSSNKVINTEPSVALRK